MTEFGLPEPENTQSELEIEKKKYDPTYQAELLEELNRSAPNNLEQTEVFNFIKNEIDTISPNRSSFIFINGPAGTFKNRKCNDI